MTATIILKASGADSAIRVALDEVCKGCEGKGRTGPRPADHPQDDRPAVMVSFNCSKCNGLGTVPTEAGKAILDLVRRYGG